MAKKKKPVGLARTRLEFLSRSDPGGHFQIELPECWQLKQEKPAPSKPPRRKLAKRKR